MKRDMELVRKILFAVENSQEEGIENFKIESFSREQIIYHIQLLSDAELIEGTLVGSDNAGILRYGIDRMTWAGHDFLDACRDEGRWTKAKEIFSKIIPFFRKNQLLFPSKRRTFERFCKIAGPSRSWIFYFWRKFSSISKIFKIRVLY